MNHKIAGWILLITSGMVMVGMIVNYNHLWFFIDIWVILASGASGIWLLRKK